MDGNDREDSLELEMVSLEEPESTESPGAGLEGLFADDMPSMSGKLNFIETMMKLATRDQKFHEFMRESLLAVMRIVKAEAGSILEIDHKRKAFFFRTAAGIVSDKVTHFVIPLGKGIVGYVAESRQPLVVDDIEENQVHLREIQKAISFDAKNMVAVPIIVRGKVFAVLELLNRVGERTFTDQDVELLQYLCEYFARAIEIRLMIAWAKTQGAAA